MVLPLYTDVCWLCIISTFWISAEKKSLVGFEPWHSVLECQRSLVPVPPVWPSAGSERTRCGLKYSILCSYSGKHSAYHSSVWTVKAKILFRSSMFKIITTKQNEGKIEIVTTDEFFNRESLKHRITFISWLMLWLFPLKKKQVTVYEKWLTSPQAS